MNKKQKVQKQENQKQEEKEQEGQKQVKQKQGKRKKEEKKRGKQKQEKQKKGKKEQKKKDLVTIYVTFFSVAIMLSIILHSFISLIESSYYIKEIEESKISKMTFVPTLKSETLFNKEFSITDRDTINYLCDILKDTYISFPNNPTTLWDCEIKIYSENEIVIKVLNTTQGVYLSYNSCPEYLRADKLSVYLKKVIQKNKVM